MEEKTKVVIDAGHGGETDPGAVFGERKEKDDNLRLALAVGSLLENGGVLVEYTRTDDVYNSPLEKAEMANRSEADYFISLHRNAAREPGRGSGTMTLVYEDGGSAGALAASINRELGRTGFDDLGIYERPDLIVLKRTTMPAVLVEAGFIDNPQDNLRFDEEFDLLASAVADGFLKFLSQQKEEEGRKDYYYMIQTGAYRIPSLARQQYNSLKSQGYPAFLLNDGMFTRVRVGAFRNLDNAVKMEQELRRDGYHTLLVYEKEQR